MNTAISNWFEHNVPRLGASVAFYTLLSLAPLLVIVIAVAGAFFGKEAAQGQLVWQIQDLIGRDGAETVQTLLKGAQKPAAGTLATVFGLLDSVLWSRNSCGGTSFRAQYNLVRAAEKKSSGLTKHCRAIEGSHDSICVCTRNGLFVAGLPGGECGIVRCSGERFNSALPMPAWVFKALDFAITYVVIAILFAMIYKWLPNLHIEWRDVILGALLTSLVVRVRQVSDRDLLGYGGHRVNLRGGRVAGGRPNLGVLFRADLLPGSGIHRRLCAVIRFAPMRSDGARCAGSREHR